jgi:hypothetical protein
VERKEEEGREEVMMGELELGRGLANGKKRGGLSVHLEALPSIYHHIFPLLCLLSLLSVFSLFLLSVCYTETFHMTIHVVKSPMTCHLTHFKTLF